MKSNNEWSNGTEPAPSILCQKEGFMESLATEKSHLQFQDPGSSAQTAFI